MGGCQGSQGSAHVDLFGAGFEVMSQLTDKCLEFVLTALWDDDDVPVAGSSGWP